VWERASKKTRVAKERCEEQRRAFRVNIEQVPVEKLVFLDECGFALNLHRLYGWAIGGARCEHDVPFNKGVNLSVVGAFSLPTPDNETGLWALWHKKEAWTGLLFELFVEEELLHRLPPGSVLVLDNARIHHRATLQQAVEKAGHSLLFLPPYSPDFNPIELVWSWFKHQVRLLAPREDDQRQSAIRHAQKLLPPQNATAWFRKCGLTPLLSE